ncbi:BnaC06g14660D [Brassica napus]|uniref:BnaC06g14660D protein n=1 Tax=Brassica napus TaxID=3708 RepID=A0A078FJB5_BRANA|nr:BnaC06g14660D [Brassica napus]
MFIDARLLRFWEARNVKRGGELMWLDLLLVDVNKREIFHDSAPLLWHSVESNYHNNTLAAGSGKKTMQEVLLNRYDCTSMEESLRIPDSLKFNNDACTRINSMIIPCCEDLIEPKSDHSHKVIEITNIAWKYLLDENLVSFKISY